jgi:hypothetical protein
MKFRCIIGVVMVSLMMVCCTTVLAAIALPASNDTSDLTITTIATCNGTFQERAVLASTHSNCNMGTGAVPPLMSSQGVNLLGYNEYTQAVRGSTSYNKTFDVNTSNKGEDENNLNSSRTVSFNGTPVKGGIYSTEEVLIHTTARGGNTSSLCPLPGEVVSAASDCTTVRSGSKLDMSNVSASSNSTARTISNTTSSVGLHYDINVHGANGPDTPAVGMASAHVDVHEMTGNDEQTGLGTETSYEEVTSIDGIGTLQKDVSYKTSHTEPA